MYESIRLWVLGVWAELEVMYALWSDGLDNLFNDDDNWPGGAVA